jgi:CRISPR-associated endonuclease/helicase Cas3
VWAKSLNERGHWLPLWQHLDDAADIAGALFDDWLTAGVQKLLAAPLDGDVEAARAAVRFLAGVHDVGKATPAFAVQDPVLSSRMCQSGLQMPATACGLPDRRRVPHALAGHHLLLHWLLDRGWHARAVAPWAVVVGGHHGVPPTPLAVADGSPTEFPDLYGGPAWAAAQRELIDRMAAHTGANQYLDRWRHARLTAAFQVVASGLVIVADWIASDESLLPFYGDRLPEVAENPARSAEALAQLALPRPWQPSDAPHSAEDLFTSRFVLPAGARLRPVQQAAHDIAAQMATPGMMVIEAPMGEGKTEAALAAAEVLSRRWGCGGVMLALPTQATTDAMFSRVVQWLDRMGSPREPVGAVTLSHGKASLNRLFRGILQTGEPAQVGCDEDGGAAGAVCGHSVTAHSWLSGRKKSQLANFVVGTIDQLLFAALKSRHLMLRHLALAGKVVVIDEVHAYDAFMNSYLMKVLTWLGAYRVPVIALSATLPAERREALLNAYTGTSVPAQNPQDDDGQGYPLISWTGDGPAAHRQAVAPSGRSVVVHVDQLAGGIHNDLVPLAELLGHLLAGGGCAAVIRNTVARVLRTAEALEQVFPGEVTIAHSRFIAADRLRKDNELLAWFGPPGEGSERPQRRIVVASQVIEQSLDVDFDVLITDLAPVDLVLQRMGRLHRHQRGDGQAERPANFRQARMFLTGADFRCQPPQLEPAAADHVYHRFPLLRSAAVLMPRFAATVTLPDDIAPLVSAAYGPEEIGPDSWLPTLETQRLRWQTSIHDRAARAATFQIDNPPADGDAILGWVSGSVGETDDDAQGQGQVRDGAPSLEVVLVERDDAGSLFTPTWLPGEQGALPIPTDRCPNSEVAAVMLQCALRLPVNLSGRDIEDALRAQTPQAWQQSKLIYRLPALVVDSDGHGLAGDRPVRYTPDTGLEVLR